MCCAVPAVSYYLHECSKHLFAVQWGANSLMISASDVDEKMRDALTKGKDVFELPILRIHWFKIREPAT